MTQALLDTDTLSLLNKRHPQIVRQAARQVRQYGHLTFSELSWTLSIWILEKATAGRQL